MALISGLIVFALRQVSDLAVDQLGPWIEKHFTDHTQALPRAVTRANDRAWQAVGLALAGEGLFDRVKDLVRDADLKAVRDQVRRFLEGTPTGFESVNPTLRSRCLEEWVRLRKAGRFSLAELRGADLARAAVSLEVAARPSDLARAASDTVARTAEALRPVAPHLATLLTAAPPAGTPLLAAAFLFFFRREIEQNAELARGLTVDVLFRLAGEQQRGFSELERSLEEQTGRLLDALGGWFADVEGRLDELRRQMAELLERNNVAGRAGSSVLQVTVTSERERALVRRLRDQLRQMPADVVAAGDWLALGDGLAASGDFDGARQSHTQAAGVAHATAESSVEAEAHFKAYRDGCEQARWADALAALRQAVTLDRGRFEPFPFRRYEPLAVLGVGGFGAVFHCRDRYGSEEVAVKALHDADLARELDEVFAEARALRQLSHPNIIGIRDQAFADPDGESRPYFVLEYFAGASLDDYRRQHGTIAPADLGPLARAIATAVHAAHQAGILHRDLKPANVLVRRGKLGWEVRVIDFGLAVRHATSVKASLAVSSNQQTQRDRSFAGTLRYAAPEQKGELSGVQVGPHSDVYAFGKTCQELLFGQPEVQSEDWEDLPEPWRGRWQKLLSACVRVRLDGARARLSGFAAVLAELDGWTAPATEVPVVVPPVPPVKQETPAAVVVTAPPVATVVPAKKIPPVVQQKAGDVLILRVPAYEPAPPPDNWPRFLSLRWQPVP